MTPPIDGLDRLHSVLVHHLVNTLGWRSLRPLQEHAVNPVCDGVDALLLAPTASGKTEAATFPLLTAMENQRWTGLSVLYLCPLKALLNNLAPRLEQYAGWLGRRVAVWHGDVTSTARRRILADPPDLLLTTPESLEAMLISLKVDERRFFAGLRAVVVDETHAFASDDRGWHLLAVLERLTVLTGQSIQRIGLSATVGNPVELLGWLQGSSRGQRPATVVAPEVQPLEEVSHGRRDSPSPVPSGAVEVDYVGSVGNAATIIASLHQGEKRLVFCDSRRLVEELGATLRGRGVTTFVSHSSLAADERRRAEQAFAQARDCVIVATSTLELGVDVGDLDRVIQINAPRSVASFLQRLGRTGRRAGTTRNCLFLALDHEALLGIVGLLDLWAAGYVEPVVAPPSPRHIIAQQLLALCLQEGGIGSELWPRAWNGLAPFDGSAAPVVAHLLEQGYVDRDGEILMVGPAAEARFGHRHFMNMTAVFTAPPQFTVLSGREEIGRTDPALLVDQVEGPRVLLLAGRSWRVTWVDWKRRRCFVVPVESGGRARWHNPGLNGASFALTRAVRRVLLAAGTSAPLTRRAADALAQAREKLINAVHPAGTVITRHGGDVRWWTWAGYRANATLGATLSQVVDRSQRVADTSLRLRPDLTPDMWRDAVRDAEDGLQLPDVDDRALAGLKFAEALPQDLAVSTLAMRLADEEGAKAILAEPVRFTSILT